jgi:hypothetical protein
MRPAEHFLSVLDSLQRSQRTDGSPIPENSVVDKIRKDFSHLLSPLVDTSVGETLFDAWWNRNKAMPQVRWASLAYMGAFILGEYDEATMPLDQDDWVDLRDAITDGAEEMDLDTLTELLDRLLARGLIS